MSDDQTLEFRRKHLKPLERRLSWLIASQSKSDKVNAWFLAEQAALERALFELRDMLDYREEIGAQERDEATCNHPAEGV